MIMKPYSSRGGAGLGGSGIRKSTVLTICCARGYNFCARNGLSSLLQYVKSNYLHDVRSLARLHCMGSDSLPTFPAEMLFDITHWTGLPLWRRSGVGGRGCGEGLNVLMQTVAPHTSYWVRSCTTVVPQSSALGVIRAAQHVCQIAVVQSRVRNMLPNVAEFATVSLCFDVVCTVMGPGIILFVPSRYAG